MTITIFDDTRVPTAEELVKVREWLRKNEGLFGASSLKATVIFQSINRAEYLSVEVDRFHKLRIHQHASGALRPESYVTLLDARQAAWLIGKLAEAIPYMVGANDPREVA